MLATTQASMVFSSISSGNTAAVAVVVDVVGGKGGGVGAL